MIFGEFLEKLAVFVCGQVFDGRKSSAEGIDLEFARDGVTYIVSIKSGPNWGNSSQIKRMVDNFKQAKRILRTANSMANIQAVNGCCYGQQSRPDKGDYLKLCGQEFWEFISGDDRLFVDIVEPLGHQAKERNKAFLGEYAKIVNLFTREFMDEFCIDGVIDWDKLVRFNSGKKAVTTNKKNSLPLPLARAGRLSQFPNHQLPTYTFANLLAAFAGALIPLPTSV